MRDEQAQLIHGGTEFAAAVADIHLVSRVYFFEEIGSTSTWGLELVTTTGENRELSGTLVVADYQTTGRGRYHRQWISPPKKSLLFSLILHSGSWDSNDASTLVNQANLSGQLLSLAAPVAVAEALEEVTALRARIKYPNDVLVGSRKIAGILLERTGKKSDWFVLGIGINVNQSGGELPGHSEYPATSVFCETGHEMDRPPLLRAILRRLADWWEMRDLAALARRMNERCDTLGRMVRIATAAGEIWGCALAINEYGALVVRETSGRLYEVFSGDIRELRDAGGASIHASELSSDRAQ